MIEAEYDAPYLVHGQLEPTSSMARFNSDGTLELWAPNQMPELFQSVAAQTAGLPPEKVILHSPILGGFFGRHFLYGAANPFLQAIQLAKATGRPVKVLWSREEEFRMDALRPLSFAPPSVPTGAQTRSRCARWAKGRSAAGSARCSRIPSTARRWRASRRSPTPSPTAEWTTSSSRIR
ncbi:molybdopterin-dependent oxidoreductase [Azospirillum sp. YIM B02556]|uniref:Molybdopterin-dependent oxidoreductase n=1 Tax=Azospirillum endophyticum TaxID=2800326 RepID=A0ABS1F1F3_9PROT|nr:molybdopterin-dependent oxidoreductase [Azospirillum endophyticum]